MNKYNRIFMMNAAAASFFLIALIALLIVD